MTKMSIVLAAALSLAAVGCKKAGGGGDCDKAIANSMELSKATMAKMPGVDDKILAKMHDLAVRNCKDDKWADEVINCMIGAKSETEAQGCYGKLTTDQQSKMNKSAMEAMSPPAAAAGTPPAGSAAAGPAAAAATGGSGAGSAPAGGW